LKRKSGSTFLKSVRDIVRIVGNGLLMGMDFPSTILSLSQEAVSLKFPTAVSCVDPAMRGFIFTGKIYKDGYSNP